MIVILKYFLIDFPLLVKPIFFMCILSAVMTVGKGPGEYCFQKKTVYKGSPIIYEEETDYLSDQCKEENGRGS